MCLVTKENFFNYLLDAWKDPLAMTNRVNNNPFLNWNPCPSVFVIFDGFILKGTTAKASLRMYRILKLQFILPLLKVEIFKNFIYIITQKNIRYLWIKRKAFPTSYLPETDDINFKVGLIFQIFVPSKHFKQTFLYWCFQLFELRRFSVL